MLPASVVVAGLSTAYIANRHADDLVVDDYYKEGLTINRRIEKKRRATDLSLSARLQFSDEAVTVAIVGPVEASKLRLLLSHPLEADEDFAVALSKVSPGHYRGVLEHKIAPHWYWILETQQENGWRLDGEVQTSEIGHAPGG